MNVAARVARLERILRKQGPWVLEGAGFACIDCGVYKDPATEDPSHHDDCAFHPDDASLMEVPGPRLQDPRLDQYLPLLEEAQTHRTLEREHALRSMAKAPLDLMLMTTSDIKEPIKLRTVGHEGATAEDPNKPAEVIPETGAADPDKQTAANDKSESQS